MNIFYITYWGINDGLSVSTAHPNLRILSQFEQLEQIHYFTIERNEGQQFKEIKLDIPKVIHHPIVSKNYKIRLITKALDVWRIRRTLLKATKMIKPDLIICRSAMAGIFGYWIHKKTGVKWLVESFEPHADYMEQSGVWTKNSISYRVESYFEQKIKQFATGLVPVSWNYYHHLIEQEKIDPKRLAVAPCYVQLDKFKFEEALRQTFRQRLNVEGCTVGIYVGKFGDIYYDEEAFALFRQALDYFPNFFLVLLTPTPEKEIQEKLQKANFPLDKAFITCAAHTDVPAYLSAADFAFSTIRPAEVRKFCSPIKDGEYWACGLPILLPDDVGDDSDIIKQQGGGAILYIDQPQKILDAFAQIQTLLQDPNHREIIRQIAIQHRNIDLQQPIYEQFLLQ